jgi:hypothetical protein
MAATIAERRVSSWNGDVYAMKTGTLWGCSLPLRLALVAGFLLLGAAGARADIYDISVSNVTYSAICVGGTGTCTEVINGSALYDSVARTASLLAVSLTGTATSGNPYTATLDEYGAVAACASSPNSTTPPYLYDSGAN